MRQAIKKDKTKVTVRKNLKPLGFVRPSSLLSEEESSVSFNGKRGECAEFEMESHDLSEKASSSSELE